MANPLMMRYAASRGDRNDGGMRNEMNYGARNEMNYGGTRNEMTYGRMENYGGYEGTRGEPAQSRYRGENGRWRSGTRRSEYGGNTRNEMKHYEYGVTVEPKQDMRREMREKPAPTGPYPMYNGGYGGDDEEGYYDDPSGRVIGFQSHLDAKNGKHEHMHKGMHHMNPMDEMEFDRDTAEEWVESMKNEDDQKPHGPKWDVNFLKPMAEKVGLPTDGPEFWEFYAVINSIYSDFCKVFNEYNFKNPIGYAKLAKAWMHDKDAVDNKAMVYYECIVKPKMEEGA